MTQRAHVFETVRRNILEVLPGLTPDMVSEQKSLTDLGANSVDRMEVVTMSMQDLGLSIPLLGFARVSNIAGLVDVFVEHLP
jgi:polyketide biosynthesis acyl carrier protein